MDRHFSRVVRFPAASTYLSEIEGQRELKGLDWGASQNTARYIQ